MIPKSERFTTRNFEFLRKKMRPCAVGPLLFFWGDGRGRSRLAVVIRKKTEKSAARRNRLKRQIYEFFRTQIPQETKGGKNIICLYNTSEIPKNTAGIFQSIEKFSQKISGKAPSKAPSKLLKK